MFVKIPPDGNCLYAAIADQLLLQGHPTTKDYYKALRQQAATYMLEHSDDFMPFVESSDGEMITSGNYITKLNEATKKSLTNLFNV